MKELGAIKIIDHILNLQVDALQSTLNHILIQLYMATKRSLCQRNLYGRQLEQSILLLIRQRQIIHFKKAYDSLSFKNFKK